MTLPHVLFCPACLSLHVRRAMDWFRNEYAVCDDCGWNNRPTFEEWQMWIDAAERVADGERR